MKPGKPRKLLPGEPEKWNHKEHRAYYHSLAVYESNTEFLGRMFADPANAPYLLPPLPPLLTPESFAEFRALLLQDRFDDLPQCQILFEAMVADMNAGHAAVNAAVAARVVAEESSRMPPV